MTYSGGQEEDRFSTCSEVSSVQDLGLEDPPPNMLGTLLSEIYTQYQWSSGGLQTPSFESNVYDDYVLQDNCLVKREPISHLTREELLEKSEVELEAILEDLKVRTKEQSSKLIGFLRRRDQGKTRQKRGYALLTRLLQAVSKRHKGNGVPPRLKFCMPAPVEPRQFGNWLDSLRALAQVAPYGIDPVWRPEVWLGCAEHNFRDVEWSSVLKFAFNEKMNPDDSMLGVQIVKDLYRTGSCRLLSPSDDRAALKRVLLAYARWNKEVGYCQGFNIITAVLLKVLNNNEASALKVMIQIVENLLPEHYFNNNLVALSVDLAVFRELLRLHLPRLWTHIGKLQGPVSKEANTYEPPLTNVFTMQWFLTLFATCLPNEVALKVWDLIFLYGAEVLFRVALAIWSSLQTAVLNTHSCDEFYVLMSTATVDIRQGRHISCEELMKRIHSIPPLHQSKLQEFREEIMYNIQVPNLGLYTRGDQEVNCMSLLMSSSKDVLPEQPRTEHSKPSLRETIKKREVEVTSRDISQLLSQYKSRTKKQQLLRTKQPIPLAANIRCVPDLGLRRKIPEKAFSFDYAELSSRQVLLQQVSGFSPSQRPHTPRKSSFPVNNLATTANGGTVRKCLFPEEGITPCSAGSNGDLLTSTSFSLVTDALAHIRVSRIPDTQTEEFCNSGYSLQKPIPEKLPSGIQAQTQSYSQDIGSLAKPGAAPDSNDETLTEVYFMEGEEHAHSTENAPITDIMTAEQKRKAWSTKSKTVSTLVYKSQEGRLSTPSSPRPFSPYPSRTFSLDHSVLSPVQTSVQIPQATSLLLTKQNSKEGSQEGGGAGGPVTRVVHAGQTSDPYFNLRKNQAFLADMHTWSLTNATSLPFMVDGRDRKKSK